MEHCTVPFDFMAEIMARSPPKTIASLMETCHALYEEGPRHLLRNGVILNNPTTASRFVTFMFASDSKRFVFLRELTITSQYMDSDWKTEALVESIKRLISSPLLSMDVLILYSPREYLLELLENNKTIRCLRLHLLKADIDYGHFPSALSPPVVSASFTMSYHTPFLQWLESHAKTLEDIRLIPTIMTPDSILPGRWDSQEGTLFQFCNTHRFVMHWYPPRREALKPTQLFRAFPNLTHFFLIPGMPDMYYPVASPWGRLEPYNDYSSEHGIREENLGDQLPCATGNWDALSEYGGGIVDLYALGIQCTTEHLKVWSCIEKLNHLKMLLDVCADTTPHSLYIYSISFGLLEDFRSILRDERMKQLRRLNITVEISRAEYKISDLALIFTKLHPLPKNLRMLDIAVHISGRFAHVVEIPEATTHALASHISSLAPHLEDICVRTPFYKSTNGLKRRIEPWLEFTEKLPWWYWAEVENFARLEALQNDYGDSD